MGRNGLAATFLTLLVLSSTSTASAPPSNSSKTSQISPVSGPTSRGGDKGLKPTVDGGKVKPKDGEMSNNNDTLKVDLENNNNHTDSAKANPPVSSKDKGNGDKEKTDNSGKSQSEKHESCEGSSNWCRDQDTMVACTRTFQNGSQQVFILVQNNGEGNLRVSVNVLTSVRNALPDLQVPNHESRRVDISSSEHASGKVILDAGNGECIIQLGRPVSVENFLQQLSFYSKQLSPLYGAYFVFLVALLFGGTWACCRFSKRSRQGEVPYQELEMGLPESASAINVETAEGWDQDWDDDWEEEDAVKSRVSHQGGNISANGLTSRSSRAEGWEDDWED